MNFPFSSTESTALNVPTLISFNLETKDNVTAQLQKHYDRDDFRQGIYWERGKGCAVGCTIHGNDHMEYERLFGIPVTIARFEDLIFEHLPNELAKEWPLQFIKAVPIERDLMPVVWLFLQWLVHQSRSVPSEGEVEIINGLTALSENKRWNMPKFFFTAKKWKDISYVAYWAARAMSAYQSKTKVIFNCHSRWAWKSLELSLSHGRFGHRAKASSVELLRLLSEAGK